MDTQKKRRLELWLLFGLNLTPLLVLPLFILWATTPTNVLHQELEWLTEIGVFVTRFSIPAGLVLGIIALWRLRRIPKAETSRGLRLAAKILAVLNITAGAVEFGVYALILIAVVFFGFTH